MLRRLAPELRVLLAGYGLEDARLQTLAATGDIVVRVRPRQSVRALPPAGAVLRMYADEAGLADMVTSEIAWLRAMADDGLHVPEPIADHDGRRQRELVLGDGRRFTCVLVGWVNGRFLDATQTPARMLQLGRLIGAMHAHADRLDADAELPTARAACTGDLDDWAEARELPDRVPAALRPVAVAAARRLREEMSALEHRRGEWGFVHGDLHFGNYLFARDSAGAIDFGICGRGPRALDLAAALQNVARPLYGNHDHRARYPAMRDALLAGYAHSMTFTPAMWRHVDLCAVARVFVTLTWLVWDWPHTRHYAWGPELLRGAEQVFREYLDG